MDIREVVNAAVSKALAPNSKEIESGSYRLDGTRVIIDLKGVLTKGEAEEYTPTTSIPTIATLALAVRLMGFQKDSFLEKLEVAMGAALAMDEQAEEYVKAFNESFAATERKVKRSLKALPKKTREGKILTANVRVDVVVNAGPALVATATVAVP